MLKKSTAQIKKPSCIISLRLKPSVVRLGKYLPQEMVDTIFHSR